MGSYRSKEDDVAKISTSIYVTNFPESFSAKDLFNSCPESTYKAAKNNQPIIAAVSNKSRSYVSKKDVGSDAAKKSYVHVAKSGSQSSKEDCSQPALVLDDSCFRNQNYSLSLIGKLKAFDSLLNLNKILEEEEGLSDINICYMGGFWVMLHYLSKTARDNFKSHVGVNSWFSVIQPALDTFSIDERVAWIDIEGVPLKVWSHNTFAKICSKWGSLLHEEFVVDRFFHRKRLCIKTSVNANIFYSFKVTVKGQVFWIRVKEVSGWAPDFSEPNDESSDSDSESFDVKTKDGFSDNDIEFFFGVF
ncbi:hypothetical protein Tco_0790134 [Tanacetum coccineum]